MKTALALLITASILVTLSRFMYLDNQIAAINKYNNGLSLALARLTKRVIALEKSH